MEESNIPAQQLPSERQPQKPMHEWQIISGSTLKIIAVISMLTDHFAAGVLSRYMSTLSTVDVDDLRWQNIYTVYDKMRSFGRIAFPIYCFLLVEGFMHTRNRKKYAARLFLFALISEIPFDLLFRGKILEHTYQNVFFTLFFGMLAMIGMDWASSRKNFPLIAKVALSCVAAAACMAAAQIACTDYAERGVFCIIALYLFRRQRKLQIAVGCSSFAVSLHESYATPAFILISLYNGQRGRSLKYFFYLFYPLHLLLLYLLCMALGIAQNPIW